MSALLKLRVGCLENPGPADLAVVESMMLWPEDEAARGRWRAAGFVDEMRGRIDSMPIDLLRLYAKAAADGPRLAELQPEANKRSGHGGIAGRIVLEAVIVAPAFDPDGASLTYIREKLAAELKPRPGDPGGYQIAPQTMANKNGPLYKFRPVAHLWAARGMAWCQGATTFPCSAADLGRFLGLAETIRTRAEETRTGRTPHPVMKPGEAVRIPDHLPVPTVTVGPALST